MKRHDDFEKEISAVNPDAFVSRARQEELFKLARSGYPLNAVRQAIREAIVGSRRNEPTPPAEKTINEEIVG